MLTSKAFEKQCAIRLNFQAGFFLILFLGRACVAPLICCLDGNWLLKFFWLNKSIFIKLYIVLNFPPPVLNQKVK